MLKIFNILVNNNKTKLPESKRPDEVGRTKDSKYCHYHRIICQDCFILKDKIQVLVVLGVLHLNKDKKQVTTNGLPLI